MSSHPGCPQSHHPSFSRLTEDKEGNSQFGSKELRSEQNEFKDQRMWVRQISTESYQIARIHIEEISLLTAAAFQKVSSTVILFQVKVGFGQCKSVQVLCIFLYLGQTYRQ